MTGRNSGGSVDGHPLHVSTLALQEEPKLEKEKQKEKQKKWTLVKMADTAFGDAAGHGDIFRWPGLV